MRINDGLLETEVAAPVYKTDINGHAGTMILGITECLHCVHHPVVLKKILFWNNRSASILD
jgi:hypothetical protein